jgi:hypothetical protein
VGKTYTTSFIWVKEGRIKAATLNNVTGNETLVRNIMPNLGCLKSIIQKVYDPQQDSSCNATCLQLAVKLRVAENSETAAHKLMLLFAFLTIMYRIFSKFCIIGMIHNTATKASQGNWFVV